MNKPRNPYKGGRLSYLSLLDQRQEAVARSWGRHMVPTREIADREGVSVNRIRRLIKEGRIPGAYKIKVACCWCWLIPSEWKYKRKNPSEYKKLAPEVAKAQKAIKKREICLLESNKHFTRKKQEHLAKLGLIK